MTAIDVQHAVAIIDDTLEQAGVPAAVREDLSPSVLGALHGRFMLIPIPTAADEAETRADLAAFDIPGLLNLTTKGRA